MLDLYLRVLSKAPEHSDVAHFEPIDIGSLEMLAWAAWFRCTGRGWWNGAQMHMIGQYRAALRNYM